jgi:hypothetical protein
MAVHPEASLHVLDEGGGGLKGKIGFLAAGECSLLDGPGEFGQAGRSRFLLVLGQGNAAGELLYL